MKVPTFCSRVLLDVGLLQPDYGGFLCPVCYLLIYDYSSKQKFSSAVPVLASLIVMRTSWYCFWTGCFIVGLRVFLWVPQDIYVCSAVCLSLLFSGVVAFKPLYWEVPTIEKGMDFFMLNLSLWVGGSPSCASFPSPYINVFCKGYQLYLLFSRPSSKKLSQSVIDGISVLGGQYHGMLNFSNSNLI